LSSTLGPRVIRYLISAGPPAPTLSPHREAIAGATRHDRHPERAIGEGPMRLIYVGLVIPRKGLLPLIEALARVRAQNWRLDVVGSLKMDRRYANRCRKLCAR
jgi:glycosyltransferase involved in cell wall biosynthesis